MKQFLFIVLAVFLLSSCLGIDSTIKLNSRGSGEILLSYKISQMVINLGKVDDESKFVPLPVTEEDFKYSAEGVDGITLVSVKEKEDEQNVYIDAKLKFDTIDNLSDFFKRAGKDILTITQENGHTVFRQIIFEGLKEGIDDDSLSMVNVFFQDYNLSFNFEAPSKIISVNHGSISDNEKSASFSVQITEIIQQKEPLIWEIIW